MHVPKPRARIRTMSRRDEEHAKALVKLRYDAKLQLNASFEVS